MTLELKDWLALCVKHSSDGVQGYYLFVQAYDSSEAWTLAKRNVNPEFRVVQVRRRKDESEAHNACHRK